MMEEQKDKPAVKKCEKDDGPAPVDDKKEQLERKTEGDAVVKNHRKVKDSAKRIVIVGASSGMGAEIARQYAKKGYYLTLAARRLQRLEEMRKECEELGAAAAYYQSTDATDYDSCGALMEMANDKMGGIDIMYYVAGQAMHVKFEEITDVRAVHQRMMGVNFDGSVWCSYHALPYLKKKNGQICVVSSVAGDMAPPYLTFYAAAKHAVNGFYESLQNEECGVDVTIVLPGYVATEIDDKKVVGDGSVQSVPLNTTPSKYMPVTQASAMIIDAVTKRKKKFHLTSAGSVASTLHALFPGMINSAVKNEMKKISKTNSDLAC